MVRVRVTAGNPIRAGQPAVNADAIIADTERRQPLALGMRSCRPVERPAPKSRSFVPFRATSVKFATVTAGTAVLQTVAAPFSTWHLDRVRTPAWSLRRATVPSTGVLRSWIDTPTRYGGARATMPARTVHRPTPRSP
jgi:hypothetical protein